MNPLIHPSVQENQVLANTTRQQAETIRILVADGFDKDIVVDAVTTNDLSKLTSSERR
jgi:hypothetical protein